MATDVDTLTYPDCLADDPSYLGDGWCENYEPYNTAECGWDGGDCVVDGYPDCHVDPDWIGDGYCDGEDYNTAECGWDGGDCNADNARLWKTYPDCNAGVGPSYIGDDDCDGGAYNTAECGWDGGDCLIEAYPDCHVDRSHWLGDGECDGDYFNTAECGWDGGDCSEANAEVWKLYPDCKGGIDPSYIGDDVCDGYTYNTAECGWDGGDCIEENKANPPPGWPGTNADLRTETLSECIASCQANHVEPIP